MPRTHNVALIRGDGTGPELAEATRMVLEASGVSFDWDVCEAGVDVLESEGTPLPQRTLDAIAACGIALKAPITTPVGTGFRSVNVHLRKHFDLFACVRPCKSYQGVRSRYDDIDLVIVRENTEYLGDLIVESVDLNHAVGRVAFVKDSGTTIREGDQVLSKIGS